MAAYVRTIELSEEDDEPVQPAIASARAKKHCACCSRKTKSACSRKMVNGLFFGFPPVTQADRVYVDLRRRARRACK